MTMSRQQKLYRLPSKPQIPGFRRMTTADVPAVHALLTAHLANFKLYVLPSSRAVSYTHLTLPTIYSV